jgi:very-short-patch-repair endonuclease
LRWTDRCATLVRMIGDLERLARIAARQHGAFTSSQADVVGLTRRGIEGLVRSGWCVRCSRGVFRVRAAPATKRQRLAIAVLSSGPDAWASHGSAAQLAEADWFGSARPEVSRPRGSSQRSGLAIVHGSLWLPPEHGTVRHGIPTTTPARTIFDLASCLPRARLDRVMDEFTRRQLCTVGQVQQVFFVLARRGRPGSGMVRAMLEDLGEERMVPASELERAFRRLIAGQGLPDPRFEVDLGGDTWIGRVDVIWSEARLVVELDSRRHHGGLTARDADRRRDNELMAEGWRVLRFTWDDLQRRPAEVMAALRRALRSAA